MIKKLIDDNEINIDDIASIIFSVFSDAPHIPLA
jgi:chorismate mutase